MTRFIDDHRVRFGVTPICRVLGRNVSTCYAYKARPLSERALRDEHLKPEIRRNFPANYRVYGHRKVYAQPRREGCTIAVCTIRRLVAEMDLAWVVRGHKKPETTRADESAARPSDLRDRDVTAPASNRRWMTDITYVRLTSGGFVYVAFVFTATVTGMMDRTGEIPWPSLGTSTGHHRGSPLATHTHNHADVTAWLAKSPRIHLHFTPTSPG